MSARDEILNYNREGVAAMDSGLGFLDNPYLNEQSDRTRHWVDGFVAALIATREYRPKKGQTISIRLPNRVS